MTPHYADDWLTVYHGDARAVLAELPAESVHCVVTSPPYWGLRDYSQPGQLGLEPTPEAYVESMVAVFREVRRVLRSDGTVWLNLGDSYAGGNSGGTYNADTWKTTDGSGGNSSWTKRQQRTTLDMKAAGLKPKDLVGIPWRVAFALQADGWYLRSDIIWAKPNPMPESVTDRPTKAHEYLFLLSKSARYYYDADAVREPHTESTLNRIEYGLKHRHPADVGVGIPPVDTERMGERFANVNGRNMRSVWTIATAPYPGAHFATFPPKLVEPCIKAGTSERGVCPECGAPWRRMLDVIPGERDDSTRNPDKAAARRGMAAIPEKGWESERQTIAWTPSCTHEAWHDESGRVPHDPIPATVLDPFAGSGTTGMVAQSLSRRAVLIDLSMDYLDQLMHRNREVPLGL